jgi:hypothetical protein
MAPQEQVSLREAGSGLALERIALGIATVLTGAALYLVPGWSELSDPCTLASIAGGVTLILMYLTHWRGDAWIPFERGVLAVFLAGMPVIYVARWLMFRPADSQPGWLAVELAGLGIFGLLTVLGLKRSSWFLVVGIAGHGIVWDLSHLTSAYMPSWYTIMCMLVDVGLGLYTAARIPAWRRASAAPASSRATPQAASQ